MAAGESSDIGGGSWRNANECLINVTDFSDFQAAVTVTAETTETEPDQEHEQEQLTTATTVTELRVPSITTTNINNICKNISSSNDIGHSNNINSNSGSNNSNNHNSNSNMSRILQPRYRFRDLLLGDFSFNDDGER